MRARKSCRCSCVTRVLVHRTRASRARAAAGIARCSARLDAATRQATAPPTAASISRTGGRASYLQRLAHGLVLLCVIIDPLLHTFAVVEINVSEVGADVQIERRDDVVMRLLMALKPGLFLVRHKRVQNPVDDADHLLRLRRLRDFLMIGRVPPEEA